MIRDSLCFYLQLINLHSQVHKVLLFCPHSVKFYINTKEVSERIQNAQSLNKKRKLKSQCLLTIQVQTHLSTIYMNRNREKKVVLQR